MTAPTSSARALHDLLAEVDGRIPASQRSGYHAWGAIVGEEIESQAFATYHAEVLALFYEVTEGIRTLPLAARTRYMQYIPRWWDALVRPRHDWATESQKIIEPAALHMLGALSDVFEGRALSRGQANPDATEFLTKSVTLLEAEVQASEDLPPTVRDQILADLRHVLWLLENVNMFGVEHAVAVVEKVAGRTAVEATKAPRAVLLKKVAVGLVTALALTATATTSVATITADVRSTFGIEASDEGGHDIVQSTVVQIYDACHTPELTAGPATGNDEPVDAEVVEEAAD